MDAERYPSVATFLPRALLEVLKVLRVLDAHIST
jgi:hypothetical protein